LKDLEIKSVNKYIYKGLIITVALFIFIYIIHKTQIAADFKISSSSINNNELLITLPLADKVISYSLSKEFIEWFVGFTEGEGNFNIKLAGLTDNTFKNVQFTFQIGLHKDEIEVLEYIMKTLRCGHISKSQNKINYFVNDKNSLLHVIIHLYLTM